MWELYNLLKDGIGENNEYLIDEISAMLDKLTKQKFILSLQLLYKNFSPNSENPLEALMLFIRGLKKNDFFKFVDFVKELNGSPQTLVQKKSDTTF